MTGRAGHKPFCVEWTPDSTWDVGCDDCDFEVIALSSLEAAEDTMRFHARQPSALGGDL